MNARPRRAVLDDVPLIGFWPDVQGKPGAGEGPEDVCFATCLRAVCQHAGRSFDYVDALGHTGSAFRLVWSPGRWDAAQDCAHLACSDSLEPYRRGAAAAGYRLRALRNPDVPAGYQDTTSWDADVTEQEARDTVAASVASGRPLVAIGVVGPPEPCLLCGHDEDGAAVIGWSCFQYDPQFAAPITTEPNGMFRSEGWWPACSGLLVLEPAGPPPKPADLDRGAVDWARHMLTTPETHGSLLGIAAYDAWIADLRTEPDDPADLQVWGDRAMIQMIAVGCIAEGRWYGGLWLARVAGRHDRPAEPLYRAAAEAAAIHRLSWDLWGACDSFAPPPKPAEALRQPAVRERAIALLERCRAHDERLAEHLSSALAAWG